MVYKLYLHKVFIKNEAEKKIKNKKIKMKQSLNLKHTAGRTCSHSLLQEHRNQN